MRKLSEQLWVGLQNVGETLVVEKATHRAETKPHNEALGIVPPHARATAVAPARAAPTHIHIVLVYDSAIARGVVDEEAIDEATLAKPPRLHRWVHLAKEIRQHNEGCWSMSRNLRNVWRHVALQSANPTHVSTTNVPSALMTEAAAPEIS